MTFSEVLRMGQRKSYSSWEFVNKVPYLHGVAFLVNLSQKIQQGFTQMLINQLKERFFETKINSIARWFKYIPAVFTTLTHVDYTRIHVLSILPIWKRKTCFWSLTAIRSTLAISIGTLQHHLAELKECSLAHEPLPNISWIQQILAKLKSKSSLTSKTVEHLQ